MNNPATTAGGTAGLVAVVLGYVFLLFNQHVVVMLLHWDPLPPEVVNACVGILIGLVINHTHGDPVARDQARAARAARAAERQTNRPPPAAALPAPSEPARTL